MFVAETFTVQNNMLLDNLSPTGLATKFPERVFLFILNFPQHININGVAKIISVLM